MDPKQKIDIAQEWKKFLKLMNLDESRMPPDQIREMKRAFFGGWSHCLVAWKDKVGEIENEDDAVKVIQDAWEQCLKFWNHETGGHMLEELFKN